MTVEITSSSEEMAASAGQIAHTASDLSPAVGTDGRDDPDARRRRRSSLVGVASKLDAGAREGVERNAHLRALALENRARLDDSSRSLTALSSDVEASAAAIEQLAQASEEVRTFVTLVQKLARQSKLLALNAAMEAARAGDHGHGFAVVAEEVRRLAAMSSDAAERTERVVSGVLRGDRAVALVERTHGRDGSRSARRDGRGLAVVRPDRDARWPKPTDGRRRSSTRSTADERPVARCADRSSIRWRRARSSFAAAMEEVAASSEEQSASTEEIAAAAGTLSGAAERLRKLVANLRLEEAPKPPDSDPPAGETSFKQALRRASEPRSMPAVRVGKPLEA